MNNPQAFPIIDYQHDSETGKNVGVYYAEIGMTLRDYFAARVLQSVVGLTSSQAGAIESAAAKVGITVPAYVANKAYMLADAMLAEREKHQP